MHKLTHGMPWIALIVVLASVSEGGAALPSEQTGAVGPDPLPKGAVARLGSSRLRHTWGVRVLSFTPNGKFLVSAGEETGGGGDSAIRVWEIPGGREVRTIPLGYRVQVRHVAVSPDGEKVIWVDSNGAIHGLGMTVALPFPGMGDPF